MHRNLCYAEKRMESYESMLKTSYSNLPPLWSILIVLYFSGRGRQDFPEVINFKNFTVYRTLVDRNRRSSGQLSSLVWGQPEFIFNETANSILMLVAWQVRQTWDTQTNTHHNPWPQGWPHKQSVWFRGLKAGHTNNQHYSVASRLATQTISITA